MMEKPDGFFDRLDMKMDSRVRWCAQNIGEVLSWVAILLLASTIAEETRWLWTHDGDWNGDATRSLGLALGALGGLYGLVVANRRLEMAKQELKLAQDNASLQKQHVNIIKQQIADANENDSITRANAFNESLTSGQDLLANERSVEVRCAGVLMLEKCGKSNLVGSKEKEIIIEVLNSFVRQRAAPPIEMVAISNWPNFFEWPKLDETQSERRDIELAITSLTSLLSTDELVRGDSRNINLQQLDLRRLRFENVDFSFLNLINSNLEHAVFRNSIFRNTHFAYSKMKFVRFIGCDFYNSMFSNADLGSATFDTIKFAGDEHSAFTSFAGSNLKESVFKNTLLLDASFMTADLTSASITTVTEMPRRQDSLYFYEKSNPPKIIANNMLIPPDIIGAYEWEKFDGKWRRKFLKESVVKIFGDMTVVWKLVDEQEENQK